ILFFFSSRRRHTRSKRDWSSDVCSSDLGECSVPTRHGDISGMTLANSSTSGAGATDMHGNCEFITYHHCTIHHASMGGGNNSYRSEERRVGKEERYERRW